MASSKNIRKQLAGCLAFTVLFNLTACGNLNVGDGLGDTLFSGTWADQFKPDVNRSKGLIVSPGIVINDFNDKYSQDNKDNNSSSNTEGGESGSNSEPDSPPSTSSKKSTGWKRPVDPSKFEAVKESTINSSIYSMYLETEIFNPIKAKLSGNKDIYFRVFNMGYDYSVEHVTVKNPASSHDQPHYRPSPIIFNSSVSNGIKAVSGDTHTMYLLEFLGQLDINREVKDTEGNVIGALEEARNAFSHKLSKMVTSGVIQDSDYYDAIVGTDVEKKLDSDILTIWQKNKNKYPQFGNLRSVLENTSSLDVGCIPDLSLDYYKSATSKKSVTLNSVKDKSHTVEGGTPVSSLAPLFGNYNQFSTRDCTVLDKLGSGAYQDDGSYLASYTNGYNRCVIYLAAREGMSLEDALGDDADDVLDIIDSIHSPLDLDYFFNEYRGGVGVVGTYVPLTNSIKGDT